MRVFIRLMKALSDPNRVRTLKLLEGGELCVCEVQKALGLAQSTVSRHMKLLEDAGLIKGRREGSWIFYSLTDGRESVYGQTMLKELSSWLNDDEELIRMFRQKTEIRGQGKLCSQPPPPEE
jgi:ArsR family transcriptional regulator